MAPKSFFSFDLTPKEEDPYTPKFTAAFPEPSYTQAEQSLDATPFFGGSGLDSAMAAKSLPEASAALGGAYQGLSGQRTKLMSELSQEQDGTDWGSVAKQAVAALFPILGGYALSGNVGGAYGAQVGGALQQQIVKSDKEDQLKRDFQIKSQIADIDKRQAAIASNKLGIDKSVYATENRPTPITSLPPVEQGRAKATMERANTDAMREGALATIMQRGGPAKDLAITIEQAMQGEGQIDPSKLSPEQVSALKLNREEFAAVFGNDTIDYLDPKPTAGSDKTFSPAQLADAAASLRAQAAVTTDPNIKAIQLTNAEQLEKSAARGESMPAYTVSSMTNTGVNTVMKDVTLQGGPAKPLEESEIKFFDQARQTNSIVNPLIERIHKTFDGKSPAEIYGKYTIEGLVPGSDVSGLRAWMTYNTLTTGAALQGKQLNEMELKAVQSLLDSPNALITGDLVTALEKMRDNVNTAAASRYQMYGTSPSGALKKQQLEMGYPDVIKQGTASMGNLGVTKQQDMNDAAAAIQTRGGWANMKPQEKSSILNAMKSHGATKQEMLDMGIPVS